MTSNHFFVPKACFDGTRAVLRGAESRHFGRVLRGRPGDEIWLFDEDGARFRARVEAVAGGEEVVCAVLERVGPSDIGPRIILGQAVLKTKTMDEVVEKAAEFGVAAVAPVVTARTVIRLAAGAGQRSARWSRIAREAAKQSRTGRPPVIEPVRRLEPFLRRRAEEVKIVLGERAEGRLRDVLAEISSKRSGRPPESAVLLVGPEGGWTDEEEARIAGAGFVPASLGRTVLRAETAATAVLAVVIHAWTE